MRIWMTMLITMFVFGASAQTHLPVPAYPYASWQPLRPVPSFFFSPVFVPFDQSNRHLQVIPYASVSAGFIFLNGGISYLSSPLGVAFVKPLNNNFAAFSNLSVAPTFFSMSRLYAAPAWQSPYSGSEFGLSTRIEGGLMYTNDARTFSISGSVSVERGSYPVYVPAAPHHQ